MSRRRTRPRGHRAPPPAAEPVVGLVFMSDGSIIEWNYDDGGGWCEDCAPIIHELRALIARWLAHHPEAVQ